MKGPDRSGPVPDLTHAPANQPAQGGLKGRPSTDGRELITKSGVTPKVPTYIDNGSGTVHSEAEPLVIGNGQKTVTPELAALRTPAGMLKIWCDHCWRWHWHGAGYGHRASHCACGNSPYDRLGYVLREPTAEEAAWGQKQTPPPWADGRRGRPGWRTQSRRWPCATCRLR